MSTRRDVGIEAVYRERRRDQQQRPIALNLEKNWLKYVHLKAM